PSGVDPVQQSDDVGRGRSVTATSPDRQPGELLAPGLVFLSSADCGMWNAEWAGRLSILGPRSRDRPRHLNSAFRIPHSALRITGTVAVPPRTRAVESRTPTRWRSPAWRFPRPASAVDRWSWERAGRASRTLPRPPAPTRAGHGAAEGRAAWRGGD